MTRSEELLPVGDLRKLVRLDDTGAGLIWLPRVKETHNGARDWRRWNTSHAGKPALVARSVKGYLGGTIHRRHYSAHRVIWALHHGAWPTGYIDHENGAPGDNRIENLRDVSLEGNARNQKRHMTNTSGRTGVHYQKASRKYAAYMRLGDRKRHLGYFESFEDACAARAKAEVENGFHPNHGQVR